MAAGSAESAHVGVNVIREVLTALPRGKASNPFVLAFLAYMCGTQHSHALGVLLKVLVSLGANVSS